MMNQQQLFYNISEWHVYCRTNWVPRNINSVMQNVTFMMKENFWVVSHGLFHIELQKKFTHSNWRIVTDGTLVWKNCIFENMFTLFQTTWSSKNILKFFCVGRLKHEYDILCTLLKKFQRISSRWFAEIYVTFVRFKIKNLKF